MKNIKVASNFQNKIAGLKSQLISKLEKRCLDLVKGEIEKPTNPNEECVLAVFDSIKDKSEVQKMASDSYNIIKSLNIFKIPNFEAQEAKDSLMMILLIEQNENQFSNQLSDNFRNLLLSLKQVHLKQTDALLESILENMTKCVGRFETTQVQIPSLPKSNKDIFKHLSKCIGQYCQDHMSNLPLSQESLDQRLREFDTKQAQKYNLMVILISGFVSICLITEKMNQALDQIEQLITKQVKSYHAQIKSQQNYLVLSPVEQKRVQRNQDLIVKQITMEMNDNRDKLKNRVQNKLDKFIKHTNDSQGVFGQTLTLIQNTQSTDASISRLRQKCQSDYLFLIQLISCFSKFLNETLNLQMKMIDFDNFIISICKQLIENNKQQNIKEVEAYLENIEKYTQFKEYTLDDHLALQALASDDFQIGAEQQATIEAKLYPTTSLSLALPDGSSKTFKLFSCQCKFNKVLKNMLDITFNQMPLNKIRFVEATLAIIDIVEVSSLLS